MRNIMKSYGIGVCLLLLSVLLPTSCIKDDYAAGGKTSVTMTFMARNGNDTSDPNLLAGEGMKHLRVIVTEAGSTKAEDREVYNWEKNFTNNETSATVTFNDLYANKKYNFYAIANEATFDKDFSTGVYGNMGDVFATVLEDNANDYIKNGLPASCFESLTVQAQANQTLSMEMQRVVGKIKVNFKNTTGESVELSNVKIPGIAYQKAFLFYQQNIPDGAKGSGDVIFGNNGTITIPAGTEESPITESSVCYIYPSPDGGYPYCLQADWNGTTRYLELEDEENKPITGIRRNQMLNITVTLKPSKGLSVVCQTLPWDGEELNYEISDKAKITLEKPNGTIFNYDGNKGYATVYSTAANASARQATFTLKMTEPENVKWIAHLTNAQDFEFVEDENHSSSGIGGADAKEVTIIVRPTKEFDGTVTRRQTDLYVTIESNPDQKQLIDAENSTSGGTALIRIVQVSEAEGGSIWNGMNL